MWQRGRGEPSRFRSNGKFAPLISVFRRGMEAELNDLKRPFSSLNHFVVVEFAHQKFSFSIVLPEIVIPDLPPDVNYDHIQHLIEHVNRVRNEYAHGSSMLHKQVLSSFEMVSEFINQIYTNSDE